MTTPIQMSAGAKRSAPQDRQVRLRQSSLEDATEIKYSPRLPQEIWSKVAADLEDSSLKSLSGVSRDSYLGALKEYNVRQYRLATTELQDLKALDNLPDIVSVGSSQSALFKQIFIEIMDDHLIPMPLVLKESIKQTLIALITNELSQDLLALKAQCYKDINDETTRFETIQQTYDSHKTGCIIKALNCLIAATPNAKRAMNLAVIDAGVFGFPSILTALLEQGQLSKKELMQAMKHAITARKDMVVKVVLAYFVEHFTMTRGDRDQMMRTAALQGSVKVLQDFMQAGLLFEEHAGNALFIAARLNKVEVVKTLLEGAKISAEDRKRALEVADQYRRFKILELLNASQS